MHYTALPKFHLSRFNLGMKLLITLYCVSVLVGLVVSFLMYTVRADLSYHGALRHYQGDEAVPQSIRDRELEEQFDRPRDELERIGRSMSISLPMSSARIVEILHPHLFSVPLVLLVLCHLFALTNTPPGIKNCATCGSFGGYLVTFGGMWIATWSRLGIWLLFAGGAVFFVSTLWITIVPITSTWLGKPRSAAGHPAPS